MAVYAFIEHALLLGASSVAFKAGSLKVSPDIAEEEQMSGQQLMPQAYLTTRHLPQIGFTLFDVDTVTQATPFGAALTPASVNAIWRQRDQTSHAAAYKRLTLAQGLLLPQSLTADANKPAELDVLAVGTYSGTTGYALSTTSGTRATPVQYRLASIVFGGATLNMPKSLKVQWKFTTETPPTEVLPTAIWLKNAQRTGSFSLLDLGAVTVARLEASAETLVANFVNHLNDSDTIAVDLGTVRAKATIEGGEANVEFMEVDVA